MSETLLELHDVATHFTVESGGLWRGTKSVVRAVDGVSLSIARGEVVGMVGESGCGKSTLARTIMQLVPATTGRIIFQGRDLTHATAAEVKTARRGMQMVFQDPFASLNPRMTIFATLAEPLHVYRVCAPDAVPARVARLLDLVGLSSRDRHKYPHEFSGGQRQRIAIARALALEPQLIIADEPVSALDVSIQAQILNLLASLVREMNLSLLFIAHDLSVVKHISDRVAVMYLGKIVEFGPANEVIERPGHPYSQALISAIPALDPAKARTRLVLAGDPPSPRQPPSGCAFHPRCPHAQAHCRETTPRLAPITSAHAAACVRLGEF